MTRLAQVHVVVVVAASTAALLAGGGNQDRTSHSRTLFTGKMPALDGGPAAVTVDVL